MTTWSAFHENPCTTSRDNFKNNLSAFGTEEKYTKSGTDCIRTLVSESGLPQLGYPIHREGEKLMKVTGDKLMGLLYENDRKNTKNAMKLRTG